MTVKHLQPALPPIPDVLPIFCDAHRLSQREREVLDLLIAGRAPKEIAGDLCIAASTVRFHSVGLYKKCRVRGQREMLALVARVLRAGTA
jgi:DNA-binding CsgD family transcriptional regulator